VSGGFENALIALVGGAGNIHAVEACFTRLRFRLARPEAADLAGIGALASVLGVYPAPERLDVLVGPSAVESARRIREAVSES